MAGVAPPNAPVMKWSRTQAEKWAKARSISLDGYFQQNGSRYKDKAFGRNYNTCRFPFAGLMVMS